MDYDLPSLVLISSQDVSYKVDEELSTLFEINQIMDHSKMSDNKCISFYIMSTYFLITHLLNVHILGFKGLVLIGLPSFPSFSFTSSFYSSFSSSPTTFLSPPPLVCLLFIIL